MKDTKLSDFSHVLNIPTRWGDMDLLGHVNNVKFFVYDESTRIAYFESLMKDNPRFWKEEGMILANLGCDFIAQLHHPADVSFGLRISKIGRSSLQTLGAAFNGDKLVAVTRGIIVWFDYVNQKTMPVPESVKEMIRSREVVKPEESV